jgi:glycosyltransferase involved in cell wall biosynthesis
MDLNQDTAKPLVSVAMLAYMHEPFLRQAIEGVLAQETDFPIELVLGEDNSGDRTREIALEYQSKHPDIIRVILSETNVGMHENCRRTFAACRGSYIALCEGDDFWTDPQKLQHQCSHMEDHPGCVLCFHPVKLLKADSKEPLDEWSPNEERSEWQIEDILASNFIPSPSVCFRNTSNGVFPDWIFDPELPMVDWPLFVWLMQKGTAHWQAESMATYRIHGGGSWSGTSERNRILKFITFHSKIQNRIHKRYRRISKQALSHFYLSLSKSFAENRREQIRYIHRAIAAVDYCPGITDLLTIIRRTGRMLIGGRRSSHDAATLP